MADSPVVTRVTDLVTPIVSDLQLDLYDIEMRGATLRIVLDTPPGSDGGVSLDTITLATRLISTELDHSDPVPGSYQLEVTSPGLERNLRTAAHFEREIGKQISVRLANTEAENRRFAGVLTAADATTATVRVTPEGSDAEPIDRVFAIADVDKAKTIFEWGPQPKKGGERNGKPKRGKAKKK